MMKSFHGRLPASPRAQKEPTWLDTQGVLNHVGLLVNGPPDTHRAALHLVVRQLNRVTDRSQFFKVADAPHDYTHCSTPIREGNVESAWNVVGHALGSRRKPQGIECFGANAAVTPPPAPRAQRICLWGGVCGAITVEQGSEAEIRQAV